MHTREGLLKDNTLQDKQKERILEIRKQQIEKKLHTDENVTVIRYSKKPFPKLALIILIFSIVGLYAVNNVAWIHIETFDGTFNLEVYRDLKGQTSAIDSIFYSKTNSLNTGIMREYFFSCPTLATYGLVGILLTSLTVLIYGFLDKKKDFSVINFNTVKFVIFSVLILPTIFLMYSVVRFFGSYLIMSQSYVSPDEVYNLYPSMISGMHWSYPASYILLMGSFVVIIIAFSEMDSSLRKILHELDRKHKNKLNNYKNQKLTYQ